MDTQEAMDTCIAMRYFTADPVPREQLTELIHYATRASNPGNSQGWDFVVIDDPGIKAQIGGRVREAMAPVFESRPKHLDGVQVIDREENCIVEFGGASRRNIFNRVLEPFQIIGEILHQIDITVELDNSSQILFRS